MTTISFQPHLNAGIPGSGASSTVKLRVAGATEEPSPTVRAVALDRGNFLRIRNGRGTRIRVASGVLWITEENSSEDHVLRPGDVLALTRTGVAIALAHRVARVVVEVPPGVALPRSVEMALAKGEFVRRITFVEPTSVSLSTIAAEIATVIGNALASIRTMVTTLSSCLEGADASNVKTYAPVTYSDGYPPRDVRRRTMRGTREVERAVIDEWMLWRM